MHKFSDVFLWFMVISGLLMQFILMQIFIAGIKKRQQPNSS